jgi:hypothetical protein
MIGRKGPHIVQAGFRDRGHVLFRVVARVKHEGVFFQIKSQGQHPLPIPASRRNRSSALPKYASTIGRGFPLTRGDSTIYQYLCPREVFCCNEAIGALPIYQCIH